jgi:hemerythrin superfamily protein
MGRPTEAIGKAMGKVKGVKQALTGGAGIFERLATQHGEVGTMIRRVGVSTKDSDARRELVPRIRKELLAHARAEDSVVYPVFMKIPGMADDMAHAKEEHDEIEDKLDECLAVGIDDDTFFAKWHAFALEVEKHVIEEEQKIFPKAKRAMTAEQSEELETKFMQAREKEMKKLEA